MRMGLMQRWDRKNQQVAERQNETRSYEDMKTSKGLKLLVAWESARFVFVGLLFLGAIVVAVVRAAF